jgi:DNA invertase Pin-like site-specific DNA recombinase
MAFFGYARVSHQSQNLDRQLDQLRELVPEERNIIIDKQSGKNFDRMGYNMLVGSDHNAPLLREGDLLIITSLDRLGRNYTEIHEQWRRVTKEIKADIQILDMPLLNTVSGPDDLDHKFIADLVLQILSYTSEKERLAIRSRQRQGIESARARGKKFGRLSVKITSDLKAILEKWETGEISAVETMRESGLK